LGVLPCPCLDLLIDNTLANAKQIVAALKDFGAPLTSILAEDFTTSDGFYQIGIAPNRVDIINQIPGVVFSEAYQRSELVKIDDLEIPFISRQDLISAKLAAGRPQDLVDAGALAKSTKK